MKFNIQEINSEQLALLGITQADMENLPKRTKDALLSGGRTSLITFKNLNVAGLEGQSLPAKLSLERMADGTASLKFHPVNDVVKNTFQLSKNEVALLQNGEKNFIEKNIAGSPHLVGIDRETNEYIAVKKEGIQAPEAINGVWLTAQQKKDFVNGNDIEIHGEKIRLQPADELGMENKSGNGIFNNIQFKHSKYTSYDLLLDLALAASGLGGIVLIGHLLNLMIHTTGNAYKNLNMQEKKKLREAVGKTASDCHEQIKRGKFITPKELKQMIEHHLNKPVETGIINEDSLLFKAGTPAGVDVVVKDNAATNEQRTEKIEKNKEAGNRQETTWESVKDFLPVKKTKISM